METIIENPNKPHNGRTLAGIIILIIGGLLLINQFNWFFIPSWLFSWPMWLIGLGLYFGSKHNFKKPVWAIMVIAGVAFLFTENIENADRVIWPIAIMGTGLWMVLKQNKNREDLYPNNQ